MRVQQAVSQVSGLPEAMILQTIERSQSDDAGAIEYASWGRSDGAIEYDSWSQVFRRPREERHG